MRTVASAKQVRHIPVPPNEWEENSNLSNKETDDKEGA